MRRHSVSSRLVRRSSRPFRACHQRSAERARAYLFSAKSHSLFRRIPHRKLAHLASTICLTTVLGRQGKPLGVERVGLSSQPDVSCAVWSERSPDIAPSTQTTTAADASAVAESLAKSSWPALLAARLTYECYRRILVLRGSHRLLGDKSTVLSVGLFTGRTQTTTPSDSFPLALASPRPGISERSVKAPLLYRRPQAPSSSPISSSAPRQGCGSSPR